MKIKLTESRLNSIISESLKRVLNENEGDGSNYNREETKKYLYQVIRRLTYLVHNELYPMTTPYQNDKLNKIVEEITEILDEARESLDIYNNEHSYRFDKLETFDDFRKK